MSDYNGDDLKQIEADVEDIVEIYVDEFGQVVRGKVDVLDVKAAG